MLQDYIEAFEMISKGIPTTLIVTGFSLVLAFTIALGMTTLRINGGKIGRKFVDLYILFFAGTPLLFQYFIFYYSPTQFTSIQGTWIMDLFNNTWFIAILVSGLNSGAYTTIIFSGAIENIEEGQWQVCSSMGLTRFQSYRLLFPYGIRRVLPTYSNEVILLFKGTSLVSMITLMDVFGYATQYYGETYDAITAFVTAGVIYLIISVILTGIMRIIEKRWLRYAI